MNLVVAPAKISLRLTRSIHQPTFLALIGQNPHKKLKLADNSAIYTLGSLEQVGSNYKAFVSYLLQNKPYICINIEPIAELLDENKLIDNLAIKYFKKRNYLDGYLDYLKRLEKENKITITEVKRTYIGSMFAECY